MLYSHLTNFLRPWILIPILLIPLSLIFSENAQKEDENEIVTVEKLIVLTSQELEAQKRLKEIMQQFGRLKQQFTQGDESPSHAGKMVRMARQIYQMIEAHHLDHLFSSEYLEELAFFTSISSKEGIRKP